MVGNMLDGIFTVQDDRLFQLLAALAREENIHIEPSAAAGFPGYYHSQRHAAYVEKLGPEAMKNSTHIIWATGGSMVPIKEIEDYVEKGNSLTPGE